MRQEPMSSLRRRALISQLTTLPIQKSKTFSQFIYLYIYLNSYDISQKWHWISIKLEYVWVQLTVYFQ